MSLKQELRGICRLYGVNYRLIKLKGRGGYYDDRNATVYISVSNLEDRLWILSSIFHEIGHHYCVENGLFKIYHDEKLDNKDEIRAYLRTAYRAELFVDKWAQKEFKIWYPELKYMTCYRTKAEKNWLYNRFNYLRESL
jgi:hypothetical protein